VVPLPGAKMASPGGGGRRFTIRRHEGFTLLETCVIILVLAALVAVAIPIISGVRREVENIVAEVNYRSGCGEMDYTWYEIIDRGGDSYVDPDTGETVDATYMNARQPTIDWYDFRPTPGAGSSEVEHEREKAGDGDGRESAERRSRNEEILRIWPDFEELPESIFGSILLVTGTGLGPDNADHSRLMVMAICRDRSVLYTLYDRGVAGSSGSFNYDDGFPGQYITPP
jgi:hypothetical protein